MTKKIVRTECVDCHSRCGVLIHVEDGKIVRIEGDPSHPWSRGMCCSMGLSTKEIHEHPDRLKYPLKRAGARGGGKWERISWDEALDTITQKTTEIREKYGPEAIITGQGTGRTWNHWHIRLNSTIGIKGWSLSPTHICLMPFMLPFAFTFGFLASGGYDSDLDSSSSIVVWGMSPASLRSTTKRILDRKFEGGKLIVIDPRFVDTAIAADLWLRVRPGTDAALALAFMHVLIKEGLYDKEFVDRWCYGFDQLAERVKGWTPEKASEITWVPAEKIVAAAKMLGENRPCVLVVRLGPGCMNTNAIQTGRALACLQALLGGIDDKGGLLIDRQWDVMLDPKITLWDRNEDPFEPSIKILGGEEYPLYKAFARSNWPNAVWRAILTGKPWPIKMLYFMANDALLCYENPQLVYEALRSPNLEFLAVTDYFMTPTGELADMVLPAAHWCEVDTVDEELHANLITSTERAVDPPGEAWNNWKFWLEWGKRLNPELWPWKDEKEMVLWRLKEFYDLDLTWDEYVKGAYFHTHWPGHTERVYKKYEKGLLRADGTPGFNTPTGRVELWSDGLAQFGYDPLPDFAEPAESPISNPALAKEYPLVLTTGAREHVFFHSAYTNIPAQRELEPYPFVEMHPEDARGLGILEGDWVAVESPRGSVVAKARLTKGIGPKVVSLPRPGWKHACKELSLPGYGWDKANPNMLIPAEPADPGFGSAPMKSTLCRIKKKELP